MKEAISGPDCTNSVICKGDCCSIKIDVPKELAEEYVKLGHATINDFIRSNIFAFQLRFDENTGKCFLFDKKRNGCSVHHSGIKPPQCWIYPTNFNTQDNNPIRCRKVNGWDIIDQEKADRAEILFYRYNSLCQLEYKEELNKIPERLKNSIPDLKLNLKKIPPSQLGGFKDHWNSIGILSAEGFSLQMKKFCFSYKKSCKFLKTNFMDCQFICRTIITQLIIYLQNHLFNLIKEEGSDVNGDYPLYKLLNRLESDIP